jgi:hypothetical protein
VIITVCGNNVTAMEEPDHTGSADTLNTLGLFRGTGDGYDLLRVPTRLEAGVMLIRLLGRERESLEGVEYSAPFEDVPEWGKPYVDYMWRNGLTQGMTATEFVPDGACTMQMYCTFVARALGFADGVDFEYAAAAEFAIATGYSDKYVGAERFNRGTMVAVSELALTVTVNGTSLSLLEQLTADGAVPSGSEFAARVSHYRRLREACRSVAESDGYDVTCVYRFTNDEYWDSFAEEELNYRFLYRDGALQFAYWDTTGLERYYRDGYIYYADSEFDRYKLPMKQSDALSQLHVTFDGDGLLNILHTVGVDREGATTIYWFSYTLNEYPDVAASILGDGYSTEFRNLVVRDIRSEIHVSPNGQLLKQVTMLRGNYDGQELQAYEEITVNALGLRVVVKFPDDLSQYQLLS